ncbi:YdeI/OmpD-associated family protein, partial [Streptomyces sp. NPDC046859]|uniref:YdeI/OmpD-associated family protein n=1 Tax=Streptomyces sp. NPDC046859 TaxID=3155734 RepID=UPI0033D96426
AKKQEATESPPETVPHSGTATGQEGQNPRASTRGASQAILYRVRDAKKPETRARRIKKFVAMLAKGEKLHP